MNIKYEGTEPKKFNPVTITLTIDTEEELLYFLAMSNVSNHTISANVPSIVDDIGRAKCVIGSDKHIDEVSMAFWRTMKTIYNRYVKGE